MLLRTSKYLSRMLLTLQQRLASGSYVIYDSVYLSSNCPGRQQIIKICFYYYYYYCHAFVGFVHFVGFCLVGFFPFLIHPCLPVQYLWGCLANHEGVLKLLLDDIVLQITFLACDRKVYFHGTLIMDKMVTNPMFWEPHRECLYVFTVNQRKMYYLQFSFVVSCLNLCFT